MYLTWIKDAVGKEYLGIKIDEYQITKFLQEMKEYLGEDDFDLYRQSQIRRDGKSFHITVVSSSEIESVLPKLGAHNFYDVINYYKKRTYEINMISLGQNSYKKDQTIFIIVKDPFLTQLRLDLNLQPKDFHITLGFRKRDIHHLTKDETSAIKNQTKFIKLFKQKFYNNDNLNWIKTLPGWHLGESEFKIVEITDNNLIVFTDSFRLHIGEAGGELKILTQSKQTSDKPGLTIVEIRDFLNKI